MCSVLFMIYQSHPHFLGTDADLSNSCFVYLVHPGWRGCALLPAGPSCPPRSSHPPAMKGSPVSTTSEQGWKCGSSLKGRIELLWSQNLKKKKKGAHESGKGPQSDIQGLGGEGDKNCNNQGEINQISVHTEENFNALLPKLEAIKLLKCTMTLTQMSPKPLLFCLLSRA